MKAIICVVCIWAGGAAAQEADCDKAVTQMDLNICADESYLAADAELNSAYDSAVTFSRVLDETGASGVEEGLKTNALATALAAEVDDRFKA